MFANTVHLQGVMNQICHFSFFPGEFLDHAIFWLYSFICCINLCTLFLNYWWLHLGEVFMRSWPFTNVINKPLLLGFLQNQNNNGTGKDSSKVFLYSRNNYWECFYLYNVLKYSFLLLVIIYFSTLSELSNASFHHLKRGSIFFISKRELNGPFIYSGTIIHQPHIPESRNQPKRVLRGQNRPGSHETYRIMMRKERTEGWMLSVVIEMTAGIFTVRKKIENYESKHLKNTPVCNHLKLGQTSLYI